jgi:hypothetical protein
MKGPTVPSGGVTENNLTINDSVISHGSSYTLSADGISFGTKPAQTPYLYDDCGGSNILDKWDYVEGYDPPDYRTVPFKGVSPPHSRMAGLIAAGMTQRPPYNLLLLKDFDMTAFPTTLYGSYYQLAHPDWTCDTGDSDQQIKPIYLEFDTGPGEYPFGTGGLADREYTGISQACLDSASYGNPNFGSGWNFDLDYTDIIDGPNAINRVGRWVRIEWCYRFDATTGRATVWEVHPLHGGHVAVLDTGANVDTTKGRTLPETWCFHFNSYVRSDNVDNYMYWADCFLDFGGERVVLGNANTIGACTYLEPQPYTAWSASEITLTANLGAVPSGTAYLYFMDGVDVVGGPLTLTAQ